MIYPNLDFKGQSLLDWAHAYLALTRFGSRQPVHSAHCGIANETLASLALNAVMSQDPSLAQQLCSYSNVINSDDEPGSDEWLYGRAGYLYFLRLLRSNFGSHRTVGPLIKNTIDRVTERVMRSPQPWTWHGKQYLGAAHGSIGIVAQLVLSGSDEKVRLDSLILDLINLQFTSGNFPSSLGPSSVNDELVQYCHGAPGFIISLLSLRDPYISVVPQIDEAIAAARSDTWKRGLLTKTPCLCHGIAGNALALGDQEQFNQFLARMTSVQLETRGWLDDAGHTDRFAGLFGGEAGRAWVWAVADKALPKACIGFNDV